MASNAAVYEIWLDSPDGRRLIAIQDYIKFSAVKVLNDVDQLAITLPSKYDYLLAPDTIFEIWRKPVGGALSLFQAFFAREFIETDADDGSEITTVVAVGPNDLLDGRKIPYAAGSSQATAVAEAADNLMKRIVRENLGSSVTDALRDLTTAGLAVEANLTTALGPSTTAAFAYKGVLETLRKISEATSTAGTAVYFGVVPVFSNGRLSFEFKVNINQPGQDLASGDSIVVFGREYGNLANPTRTYNLIDTKNVVYVGGQGTGADRAVVTVLDAAAEASTPWARRESFVNVSGQESSVDGYTAAGNTELSETAPKSTFSGDLLDAPQSRFGKHWNWGDRVIVSYRSKQYTVLITAVGIAIADGKETIAVEFEEV